MYFSIDFEKDISLVKEGYELIYKVKFSKEDVLMFSQVTGDDNLIHTDIEYAKNTIFKQPIAFGISYKTSEFNIFIIVIFKIFFIILSGLV